MVDLSGVKLERCLDCGKCTAICPVARYNHSLSPRRLVRRGLEGRVDGEGDAVWSCLTCMRCDSICPQEVTISRLLPRLREKIRAEGGEPPNSRCGAMDAVMVLQSQAPLQQNRLDWLPTDVETDPESKTITAYGILNKDAPKQIQGVPHPCTFLIGKDGVIKAKLSKPGYRKRHTTKELIDAAKSATSGSGE